MFYLKAQRYQSDAIRLAKLIRGIDCKVNIIPYNETDGKYKDPMMRKLKNFWKFLINTAQALEYLFAGVRV